MRPEREPDLLRGPETLRDRVQRGVEGGGTLSRRLVEKLLLALDVRVERALLDAERVREVADRGPVVPLLREEAGGMAGELLATRRSANLLSLTIGR